MTEGQVLVPGIQIVIQRSDGRIHPAIVATVHEISQIITVEWYENDMTQGKEIGFETVFSLNPQLYQRKSLANRVRIPTTQHKGRKRRSLPHLNSGKSSQSNQSIRNLKSLPKSALASHTWQDIENIPPKKKMSAEDARVQVKQPWQRSKVAEEVERIKAKREERRRKAAQKQEAIEAVIKAEKSNPNWLENTMIKEYKQKINFKPLVLTDHIEERQITVCVRKRPLSKKEKQKKDIDILTLPQKDLIVVHEPRTKVDMTKYLENQSFRFDYAFDELSTNEMVYHFTAGPLVRTIFQGGRATCFAYGQTGSGKTHTMSGSILGKSQDYSKGIYALTATDIFKHVELPQYSSLRLGVSASYFEIYRGKLYDLLDQRTRLNILENRQQQVQVLGLTETVVVSVEEVLKLIKLGNKARTSGRTSANVNSSRSHAVFQIILREPLAMSVYGKFSLIDLAGNERGKDTTTSNQIRRMEGGDINKSLLALKECIRALGRKGAHLPFRTSKLTQVLKDSFIGENSKTCMIAMVSPGINSCEHTLNTLHYANRVKELDPNDILPQNVSSPKTVSEEEINNEEEEEEESLEEDRTPEEDEIRENEELVRMYNVWRECCRKCDFLEQQLFSNKSQLNQRKFMKQLDVVLRERQQLLQKFRQNISKRIEHNLNNLSISGADDESSTETSFETNEEYIV